MSEAWTQWQGHVINGTFPLRRYLGSSDHSAVFLTELAAREPSEVALKLTPATAGVEDAQLADWSSAAGLAHPHLIRLLETGRCQLDGMAYLYAVMEYADQSLAEVLRKRALTEGEASEMLLPTLNALAVLHSRNLVQGRLKPSNVLAVADQLKLASDTVRRVGEARPSSHKASIYDPPEAWDEGYSTAGDIWALGVTLFEALTRSPPLGLDERRGVVPLPPDFSPTFREIVTGCLSRRPYDRPKVTEIEAWVRRQSGESITPRSAPPPAPREPVARESAAPEPKIPQPIAARSAAPAPALPERAAPEASKVESRIEPAQRPPVRAVVSQDVAALLFSKWRAFAPVILGAVVVLVLGWTAVRALRSHGNPTPTSVQAPQGAPSQTPGEGPHVVPPVPSPVAAASNRNSGSIARTTQVKATTLSSVIHEEVPDVPRSARRTIRGHIKVYVRVIVDPDGTVYAALADRPGPSRYFERLSIEAAKKWTFPPADTEGQRLLQVRFDFSRGGTTARAVTLK